MKTIKILVAIILTEIAIAIPVITGIHIWSMTAFTPDNGNESAIVDATEETCEHDIYDKLVPIKDINED